MSGRASIESTSSLVDKLSFSKQGSGGIVGLLLKSILSRSSLRSDAQNSSLFDEFKYFTQSEVVKILEHGAELWMILKKIHLTGCNRSSSSKESEKQDQIIYLKSQFENAHAFLINKIIEHNN